MSARVLAPDETDLRKIVVAVNQYAQGRSNAGGTFTCTIGSSTTTVTDANVGSTSQIAVCPATGVASVELGGGSFFIDTIAAGSFVAHHTNTATANRTFRYVVQG